MKILVFAGVVFNLMKNIPSDSREDFCGVFTKSAESVFLQCEEIGDIRIDAKCERGLFENEFVKLWFRKNDLNQIEIVSVQE